MNFEHWTTLKNQQREMIQRHNTEKHCASAIIKDIDSKLMRAREQLEDARDRI